MVSMSTLREFVGSKFGLGVCLILSVIGGYLIWTHTGHVLSTLPYVILLACPLLHLFGHGHGGSHGNHASRSEKSPLQN
jgi:hypothetical protein